MKSMLPMRELDSLISFYLAYARFGCYLSDMFQLWEFVTWTLIDVRE